MTEPRKRSAAETWRALEEMTEEAEEDAKIDAEMERILSLSADEISRELADAGFDPEAVRARGEAIGREAKAHEAPADTRPVAPVAPVAAPREQPIKPRRATGVRTVLLLIAAALALAALLMAVLIVLDSRPENVASPPPTPVPAPGPQEK